MDSFDRLVGIVAQLRAPEGCPWDRAQTPETMRPYLVEEVHVGVGAHGPSTERYGEVALAVALDVAEALEGGDAARDAEARHGAGRIERLAGARAA